MDNFTLNVVSLSRDNFDMAMQIAFSQHGEARAYRKEKDKFILAWLGCDGTLDLPVAMNTRAASDLVWLWLQTEADYGKEPMHDGSNARGFRVYVEQWGHVFPIGHCAIVGIQPAWAMFGK